ncbi:MAG: hypothetical protein K9L85_01990 [Candidatus Peribacteraceae bacterium]|nr:hypothetical protein [Candidatus Peribacteraceae bacterium]
MKSVFHFSRTADKEFAKLNQSVRRRIFEKLIFWGKQSDPFIFAKKLTGSTKRFRFRVGDYRIVVSRRRSGEIVILLILRIAHRREIYD